MGGADRDHPGDLRRARRGHAFGGGRRRQRVTQRRDRRRDRGPAGAPDALSAAPPPPPLVVVLTGPSGVGKDALVNRMHERGFLIVRPATMTTRAPRDGEVDGVHHLFVSHEAFIAAWERGELLERAEVYGRLYGVPRSAVRAALASGGHVVIRVDVQGAETLHRLLPGALFLALEPSSPEALRQHLDARGSEAGSEIERRLALAREEVARARAFCTPVTNVEGDIDATVDKVAALIEREAARPGRRAVAV
ncbi:MAG: guanylate kinase [Dehalococcoidia bacterium]|nr:guanylate kinase [Dehalococcoidia bacterium]